MLSWVRQLLATEHEFLESLFGLKTRNDGQMVGSINELML